LIELSGYAEKFLPNTPFRFSHYLFDCTIADVVVQNMRGDLFAKAQAIVTMAEVLTPSKEATQRVGEAFARGVPFDDNVALGDLINAGWRLFQNREQSLHIKQGRNLVDYVSDLILKSAEIHEIGKILQ